MTTNLRQRIDIAEPLVVDMGIAIALCALSSLQIWAFSSFVGHGGPTPPPVRGIYMGPASPGATAYALAILCFLPLALRRKIPWLSLLLTGGFTLTYALYPGMPPAFTTLAPMLALYTLASRASRRRTATFALIAVALVIAVPLVAISGNAHWLREAVSTAVLLAGAALLGDSARSRREYIEEVEQRALEAERTREEEARRRVDEERIRIAREVHDVLAHSLSIVTVQAAAAESLVEREPARAKESIDHIRSVSRQALAELRSVLTVLRTADSDAPLAPATTIADIDRLIAPVREAGFDIALETSGDLSAVPAFAAVSAYRIVQEALTNAVRHAHASHIAVHVAADDEILSLEVSDDGAGAAGTDLAATPGHGIRGMRERVEALDGTFAAGSREGGGFSVTASIPLRRAS